MGRDRGGQAVRIGDEVDARVGQIRSGQAERTATDGGDVGSMVVMMVMLLQVRQVGQLERLLQMPRTGAQLIGLQLI